MLLIHQAGSVKVGEVVRYTVTYTPSLDRILPSPSHLFVRIKNTSAVPLRAAYLHGPYALHVCSYPSTFNPNQKLEAPKRDGIPEFEPNLKAGGHWHAKLSIPEDIRESGEKANIKRNTDGSARNFTWVVEIASQILFSNTAAVSYELLVSRDERSLDIGFASVAGKGHGEPGNIKDFQQRDSTTQARSTQPRGVYSRAIDLIAEDTATLWNKPPLPQWGDDKAELPTDITDGVQGGDTKDGPKRQRKPKKIHLVILTHGLHSNVGADMLYMKERIDATAREAREAAKTRRQARHKEAVKGKAAQPSDDDTKSADGQIHRAATTTAPNPDGQEHIADDEHEENEADEDDEQVIVRGFWGNACRTDRGVQYLGKRLAKFVLSTTYPDQPFLPASKTRSFTGAFGSKNKDSNKYGAQVHQGSTIHRKDSKEKLPYTFTSISFIGHSLGGLVQVYAAAYIHKHSPGFFEQIKPRSFVAMAAPLLGLSNENPLYVKFALDFGLVGRTGQDLGLTWRAPTIARNGWSAMIAGFSGNNSQPSSQEKQSDPGAKPLLRILPTGPAHQVLKMFDNRTLYANIVNDGIVPLRTSSLMFLDWRSLEKVDNAQRQNGLIGTMAAFGWAEITGASSTSHRPATASTVGSEQAPGQEDTNEGSHSSQTALRLTTDVGPQPQVQSPTSDQRTPASPAPNQFLNGQPPDERARSSDGRLQSSHEEDHPTRSYTLPNNPLTDFINLFRPGPGKMHPDHPRRMSKKIAKTYHRAQTIKSGEEEPDDPEAIVHSEEKKSSRPRVSRGDTLEHDPNRMPPPKTSIFDAASDVLNPPLPAQSWLIDPSKRARTIFHDRVYHPEDIPPPPTKRPRLSRSFSNGSIRSSLSQQEPLDQFDDGSGMRVEEKIARAYHSGMSWRKVLVRLEPDAHNNMIVRRLFANAHGWDVVKHVCDTHFADTYSAQTRDEEESNVDRAYASNKPTTEDAEQVKGQTTLEPQGPPRDRTFSETAEAADKLSDLQKPIAETSNLTSASGATKLPQRLRSQDSGEWSDSFFDDGDDGDDADDDDNEDAREGPFQTFQRFWQGSPKPEKKQADRQWPGQAQPESTQIVTQEPTSIESHRGLGVIQEPDPISPVHPTADADTVEPLLAESARPENLDELQPPMSANSVSQIGLREPPGAHLNDSPSSPINSQAGVAEKVARLSLGSKDGKE